MVPHINVGDSLLSYPLYTKSFAVSLLLCFKLLFMFYQDQKGFPEGLFAVKMYALTTDIPKKVHRTRSKTKINRPRIIKWLICPVVLNFGQKPIFFFHSFIWEITCCIMMLFRVGINFRICFIILQSHWLNCGIQLSTIMSTLELPEISSITY